MNKNAKKFFAAAADFCGQALFVLAVSDLAAACKARVESPVGRTLIDVAAGVVVGLHAAYRGGLLESAPAVEEPSPDPDDWTGDEAPFVEEE